MRRKIFIIFLLSVISLSCSCRLCAQNDDITISPTAFVTNEDGEEEECTEYSGSAPLKVRFVPNVSSADGTYAYYEWRFYKEGGSISDPYLVRHEEETEMTFTESGTHCIALVSYFTQGTDTLMKFDEDYWTDVTPIRITVSESKLDFPNAFSPNGDGINDIYKAKDGWQSIVSFKAVIFNRWGQKIYEWTDPAGGWDGTFHGSPVKQGVYYVNVEAKGADGIKYHYKKDVNLLRSYDETSTSSSSSTQN